MIKGEHTGVLPKSEALHLLAALVSGHTAPRDVPAGQWEQLTDLAQVHGLGPMLLWAVHHAGIDILPRENRLALEASARQSAAADMLYEDSLRTVSQALASAHIQAVWLKGAVLSRTVYPEPALRPMGDLDVLVPLAQIEDALQILKGLGYDFYNGYHPEKRTCRDEAYVRHVSTHHYVLTGGRTGTVLVELHFNLLEHDNERLLPPERLVWFFENVRPFYLNDRTACIAMTPEAHLLYLVAHMVMKHGESQLYLMRDLDIHLLIIRHSPDWNSVVDQAVVLGWTSAVARVLKDVVAFFETPVPETVFQELEKRRPAHEDLSLLFQAESPGYRWECRRKVLARLSPREKMHFFIQNLLPSPGCMRSLYSVHPDRPIWPYYPYRWFILSREIARATGKRMRLAWGGKS